MSNIKNAEKMFGGEGNHCCMKSLASSEWEKGILLIVYTFVGLQVMGVEGTLIFT